MNPSSSGHAVGADLGGTFLKLGAVAAHGEVMRRARMRTHRSGDAALFIDWLCDALRAFLADLPDDVVGIGIGSPGLIDPGRGRAIRITNIPGLDGMAMAETVSDRLGRATILENDVNAMAYGEFLYGAGRPFRNIVCLTLGTGVGGGLVLNDALYRGSGFTAGEIGHVCIDPDGPPCPCGSRGCLERYVGNEGIVREALWRLGAGWPTSLSPAGPRGDGITPEDIAEAARQGDRLAAEVFEEAGRRLGRVLGGLMNVLAPDAFIVGGGVANAGELILEPARLEARMRVFADLRDRVRVLPAALGNDAGIVGCAALVRESVR